ncbi:WxL domain-containing protein [Enterococcus sp. BWM-S5]|uniref:WxL domain-containing protein n=1 Tax=Enterococcus larvae TaxID=2794352 RepID=A0ABS4CEM6_9ENTE|nr:WxL domain-containing protein [Enterococcus larvae]MBP1044697.1 WxL domain-containing protein [Enterococcus larvae]
MDARAYNVRIVDNTLGNSGWKLLVRRIPFVHVGTGKQIENEHFFVGQMKDNAEVHGVDISDPNSNWNDPNGYELYSATTIGFDNIGVANYKGTAAKGEHLISMLSPDNEEGKNLKQPDLPIDQDYIYTEKNITLGLDKHSVISEAGQYQATLVWTLQVAPAL